MLSFLYSFSFKLWPTLLLCCIEMFIYERLSFFQNIQYCCGIIQTVLLCRIYIQYDHNLRHNANIPNRNSSVYSIIHARIDEIFSYGPKWRKNTEYWKNVAKKRRFQKNRKNVELKRQDAVAKSVTICIWCKAESFASLYATASTRMSGSFFFQTSIRPPKIWNFHKFNFSAIRRFFRHFAPIPKFWIISFFNYSQIWKVIRLCYL